MKFGGMASGAFLVYFSRARLLFVLRMPFTGHKGSEIIPAVLMNDMQLTLTLRFFGEISKL